MSWFPSGNCTTNSIMLANGATTPTSDIRFGALEVLLLEALLNPVHHVDVVDGLLHKTLQDLVLGENQEDFHGDAETARNPLLHAA